MKKYIFLLIIIPFLTNCGAGGGGGVVNNPGGGDDGTSNKPNTACSGSSNIAKIRIKEDGVYRITYSALCSAGINLSGTDITTLKMTNQKDEVAIDVVDSNGNGVFDDGDYAEFYGKVLARDDSRFRFTETNVYWLSAEVGGRKRIEKIASDPQITETETTFLKTLHLEKDTWYVQESYPEITSPSDIRADIREHWFWGNRIYPGDKINLTFSTRYIDRSVPVSLKIRLQSVSLNHYTKVYVNGKLVSEKIWESQNPYDIEISGVDPSIFYNSGPNNLIVESAGGGLFYLDWFEVTYSRFYGAEYNEIEFTGKGRINLSNFNEADISIYNISDPGNLKKIIPLSIEVSIEGSVLSGYTATFSSLQESEGRFLAFTTGARKTPLALEAYVPAGIGSNSNSADYIIITHEDFYDAIIPLAGYRANEGGGYRVLTVKIKDIYDEFSDGIETPQAIKEFLTYAYKNWAAKPRYILLVGDATIDFKDVSGYGSADGVKSYVPAYLYNYPGLGEVPSDNWFVDVEGDVLPEMNIGRIPAKSPADVSAAINKIISHEQSIYRSNKIVLIADHDPTYIQPIFEELSESIEGLITGGYDVLRLYQREYLDDLRAGIISSINSGSLIVNYTGHGSVVDWTKDDAFSSEDIVYLTNKGIYPFIVALNCLNGYFVLPDDGVYKDGNKQYPSIAETFLLSSEKGAVAVFAASAIGYPSEHDPLAQALYEILFSEGLTLGEAVTKAKVDAYQNGEIMEHVVETFIFFGDPATRLK
ncbi:MAG: hypothetical protein HZA12_02885 [Nitrospirae bacterium]|nr:hypothetical protein [Nitrospirota bacterium]